MSVPQKRFRYPLTIFTRNIRQISLEQGNSNDVAGLLQQCLAGSAPYYQIAVDRRLADHQDEYHHLEVQIPKPGLTARTLQGYYAQPLPQK